MDKDYILKVLRECADEGLPDPRRNMRIEHFEELVYRKWAAREVIERIERSDLPPAETLVKLIGSIDRHKSKTKEAQMIFSILRDMADAMLDVVGAMTDVSM